MDVVNYLERALLELLSQNREVFATSRSDSFYNNIPLISDEGYQSILQKPFDDYITELENYIEKQKFGKESEILKSFINKKIKRVNDILIKQEANLKTWEGRLENERLALSNSVTYQNAYFALTASVEAMNSIVYMIGVQISNLNQIKLKYKSILSEVKKTPKIASVSIGLAEIDLAKYPTKLICLVEYEVIVEMLHILKRYGHVRSFGKNGFIRFISLLEFSIYKLPDDLGVLLENKIELIENSDKITWAASNTMFVEWYWWMISNGFIEMPMEGTGKFFANCFYDIFKFENMKEETKDPVESLRKAISSYGSSSQYKSRISKSNISDILKPLLHSE